MLFSIFAILTLREIAACVCSPDWEPQNIQQYIIFRIIPPSTGMTVPLIKLLSG